MTLAPRPTPTRRASVAVYLALALLTAAVAPPLASAQAAAPRIVAIGDVHGAYDELVALLRAVGLVDAQLAWSGGNDKLVLLGDVLDRGAGSRQALELVMRLHEEAARAGGEAQLVLGNHEVMDLTGDLSYATPAEYAAYRDDEPPAQRAAALERYRTAAAGRRDEATLAAEFAALYPPGFFGQRALFAARGRIGAWLLDRPVIATIGRTAFVHGGLSTAVAGKDAATINREYAAALRGYADAAATLMEAGVIFPETNAREQFARAAQVAASAAAPTAVRSAAAKLQALATSPIFSPDSVYWYRGTASCSAAIEEDRLTAELRVLGVDRVVVGHTPTADRRVLRRFDGKVLRADTGMLGSYFGGRAAAIVMRDDDVRVVYADSREETEPLPQPRQVGRTAPNIDDAALERLLTSASIVSRTPGKDGTETIALAGGGTRITALFVPAHRGAGAVLADVAAYRLDRLLGADIVPVAVLRELDGRTGSLRVDDSRLLDDDARRARPESADAQCPLLDQINLMYTFDALTHNDDRVSSTIRYVPDGWRLTIGDNKGTFSAATDLPEYLLKVLQVPPELAARLASLTPEIVEQRLGEVLDARQRAALLARRDRLVALAGSAAR